MTRAGDRCLRTARRDRPVPPSGLGACATAAKSSPTVGRVWFVDSSLGRGRALGTNARILEDHLAAGSRPASDELVGVVMRHRRAARSASCLGQPIGSLAASGVPQSCRVPRALFPGDGSLSSSNGRRTEPTTRPVTSREARQRAASSAFSIAVVTRARDRTPPRKRRARARGDLWRGSSVPS